MCTSPEQLTVNTKNQLHYVKSLGFPWQRNYTKYNILKKKALCTLGFIGAWSKILGFVAKFK